VLVVQLLLNTGLLLCRLLANLYNGNVYIWNYNDSVGGAGSAQQRAVSCAAEQAQQQSYSWWSLVVIVI
jgi:hypothetical protein